MTRARKELVSLESTPYYHVVSRCVRRAFLCGVDSVSQKNFDHRRGWIADRIKELSQVFALDIAAYAVMSNHYHIVLRIDREKSLSWSDEEVMARWYSLFHGNLLVDRYRAGKATSRAEKDAAKAVIAVWRKRLYDLGWYMKCLNEHIARQANEEDDCKGRFWEGRYKSQALLDEKALLTCMAYVDLNPIRAALAKTPETSDYTSVQERLATMGSKRKTPQPLLAFAETEHKNQDEKAIPFNLNDYLTLVDWTGRTIRNDKRGSIPESLPPILERLQMSQDTWLEAVHKASHRYGLAKGTIERLQDYANAIGNRWIRGQAWCRCHFQTAPT